ncbi:AMP-binding protein, partial [Streptomyces goshikiensis]
YTSVFDLDAHPLPDGVSAAGWLSSTPGVALDCVAVQDGDVLEFAWDALPQRLPEGLLDEAFARFAADLAGLAELTGAPVEDPAVPAARWNDTARPFPAELPVQVLIEDQVRVRPADVAVRWAGGALTYEELDLRANRLAWTLREAGVGRGDMVGVSVRRGPDMVVAVLGILKAGGAYLPVLPSLPRDRAQVLLTDAAAAFLLHDSACPWAASVTGVRAVDLDAVLARPHRREERAPEPVNDVDDLAYVIFTSGSTGRPKGVSMAHRPLLNLFEWARRTFALGPGVGRGAGPPRGGGGMTPPSPGTRRAPRRSTTASSTRSSTAASRWSPPTAPSRPPSRTSSPPCPPPRDRPAVRIGPDVPNATESPVLPRRP